MRRTEQALCSAVWIGLLLLGCRAADVQDSPPGEPAGPLQLELHWRVPGPAGDWSFQELREWAPERTALVICDMWDDHWCAGAARRVAELAGPLNEVVELARSRGVLILHAPSSVVDFYAGSEQRERARNAPFSQTPVPLSTDERWGTTWCWPDETREWELPIDDSDMGCDCETKCVIRDAWTRQIETIVMHPEDALTDDGQETYNLLEENGIEHVILCGVHLNMCVLGRPFGIRQLVTLGKDVALMRDMTDSMYDPRSAPFVDHFRGTELVVEHVERHWCPSTTSSAFTGRAPFRFAGGPREQP